MNGTFCIPFPGRLRRRSAHSSRAVDRVRRQGGFLAGPENRLVEVALESALFERPSHFHPLIFCGPSGSGKSHLAMGLAAEWRRLRPTSGVQCCPAADFAADFAAAVEDSSVAEMRLRFESADLIVVEDLDHLACRTAAQHELSALLDRSERRGAVVVLTSRRPPLRLSNLAARLRGRLAGGLTVEVHLPGCATRVQMLEQFASQRGLTLDPAATQVIAAERKRNAWELQGVVEKMHATLEGSPECDRAAIDGLLHKAARPTIPIREIAKATAGHFRHTLTELRSPTRRRTIVLARGAAMLLCREFANASLGAIGAYFGNRDHATVLHACRRTIKRSADDLNLRQSLSILRNRLQHYRNSQ